MLPAPQRLRANQDFRRVYAHGRSWKNEFAVLYNMRRTGEVANEAPGRRIGFVVSKKQGDAVVRNRIKRRLREAVRLRLPDLREGAYDLILVGRSRLKTASWPEVQAAVDDLLRRANLLRGSAAGSVAVKPVGDREESAV
jgi:ribonuclease P protein component